MYSFLLLHSVHHTLQLYLFSFKILNTLVLLLFKCAHVGAISVQYIGLWTPFLNPVPYCHNVIIIDDVFF